MTPDRARIDYRTHIDPEYRRWGAKYPRFPGVAECIRLLCASNVQGAWVDIITCELANHASECLPELLAVYQSNEKARIWVLMAIEDARLPAAIPCLEQIARDQNPRFAVYGERGLMAIDTRKSREALWRLKNSQPATGS